MSAPRKIHALTFDISGLVDEDKADELLDDIEEFADGIAWPLGLPDAYKCQGEAVDGHIRCAVELQVRATVNAGAVDADKRDFAAAMALIEHLRGLSRRQRLTIEVDFDGETIGSIECGAFDAALKSGLIEPWTAALAP